MRLPEAERRRLRFVLLMATATLAVLIGFGIIVERQSRTPLVQVGQAAPDWALPAASGEIAALAEQRGHAVLLAFVPSVNCPICRTQLGALQDALPELSRRGVVVFAISTDLPAIQRTIAGQLDLTYPLLSEAPAFGLHPVSSAYGVYHRAQGANGPVDVNALIVIDAAGVVRVVMVQPRQSIDAARLVALVDAGVSAQGSRP
jgi:thioredoxin-dependent peroxiredoxin